MMEEQEPSESSDEDLVRKVNEDLREKIKTLLDDILFEDGF
jgi:hypothetical protein